MSGPCQHQHQHREGEVSCKGAYDLLFEYLEGSLTPEKAQAVRAHFDLCPPCLEFVESYRQTPALTRAALEEAVPPEVKASVKDFLRAHRKA